MPQFEFPSLSLRFEISSLSVYLSVYLISLYPLRGFVCVPPEDSCDLILKFETNLPLAFCIYFFDGSGDSYWTRPGRSFTEKLVSRIPVPADFS